MALVSVYLVDTERLYETCEAIDKSKEKFSNNPSVSSSNSSVGAITSKINELGNEIKKDYETTSKTLRNYTNKVEANENKLKSKAISLLENDSVVKNIPVMVTDSKTGTSEKTKETFADSIKPRIENNINVNMLNSLEVAQGIVKTYEGQVKTIKKEETLKDIADEFFENQRKSVVFPGSAINSQNNGAFASSVGNLNSVNKAIEVDPERIVKAKENTDKINTIAKEKRFEEEKNQAYIINDISDAVGTALGNPISVIGNIKDGVFSVAKIGGYAYSGVKSLFTGEKLTDVANETIEKISDAERKVDDEIIGAKLFVSEGVYSTAESLVKGVAVISGFVPTKLSSIALNEIDKATGWNYKEMFEQKVSEILGTNWVHDKFSSFYEENGYGNHLKDNLMGFDTQRNIGNTVGAAIPTIAAGLATGGTGSIIVGGLSSTGSGTTTALQEGATLSEAENYGIAKGALSAATFGAGKAINTLNIFGRGTVAQTLGNAGARVLADTGLGAVTSLADDVLRQLYVPRNKFNDKNFGFSSEEEWTKASFGDKFNAYFNDAGGWESIKSGAITGAVYSTVFEGISAVKEISSINAANKVYSDAKSNVEEVNNIKNQNMLNENNSLASNSLEDLYAQRKSIQEAYDSLDDQAKYFFQLKRAKDGIASGAITSAGIDNFINSGMAKVMYGDLNNQERLLLIDKMNETQIEDFFNQIGKTKAQTFLNRNSTYFTERFFNTDSTNSTWTNTTALVVPSGASLAPAAAAKVNNVSSFVTMYPVRLSQVVDSVVDSTSKIGFQFFANSSETDLSSTKEFIDNARELSSQGKITQEYVKSLTDDQYKAILLQVDENPKLVSDVISMIDNNTQVQQVINVIKNMNGDELATVMDVNEFGMGFITRNAINNLDESQITETLIRKVASLDDDRFKDFLKENTNSTLFSNQEIFDRAIATATKERKHFIFGLSDEIQFKIISNKEYVDMITDLGDINKVMNDLSLKNKEVLLNNIDFNNVSGQEKINIFSNLTDDNLQKIFIDKTALFYNPEWKKLDNFDKRLCLKKIIDLDTRLECIKKSGILDDLHDDLDIWSLIGMFNEKDKARALAELPLTTEQLKIALKYVDTDVLLTQISDSTTYLDKILEDVKSGKTKISIKNLLQSSSSVDTKVQYYITLAKHDMVDYVDKLSVDDILENKNGTTLLAGLLDADKNLTINKILSDEVKFDPKVATILKLRGLDTGKINISHGTEKYNSDYIKKFNSSLGIGPIHQKGEALLNELQELFLNDGKSDKEIVESLVNGYRQGLIVDYDNCVKELQNLVNVKKQNLDRFYYIKQANTGYFMPSTGSIYMDDAVAETSLHETGHALHEYLAQTSTPKNYMEVIERAKANQDFMKNVEEYYDYYRSLSYNAYLRAQEAADTYFKDYYTDEKIEEITKLLSKSREELKQEFGSLGMMDDELDATIIDIITKNMYKPEEYIETQKRIFVSQTHDAIMRSEYGGVTAIGDYIDRITDGTFQSGKLLKEDGTPMIGVYGHGLSYYFATNHGFDEMVANFASMSKMPNSKENLQMLKGIIGEEMYDMISSYYYKNIVNYGG